MAFDNLPANRQADPGARIFRLGMEALKDDEDALRILRRNPDPIVPDGKVPGISLARGGEGDLWRRLAAILDRVGNQILEELAELHPVARYRR
jgi:hypothetical protein